MTKSLFSKADRLLFKIRKYEEYINKHTLLLEAGKKELQNVIKSMKADEFFIWGMKSKYLNQRIK
jgi:predicted metallo-beta-lactamase superfamily hydrolase